MITSAFGKEPPSYQVYKKRVSVNIKVQKDLLASYRARLLKVHATSTPGPVSRPESCHLPVYLIYINASYSRLVKEK